MCQGFSAIVTRNGLCVYFTMWDNDGDIHHHHILDALDMPEDRDKYYFEDWRFIRTENYMWDEESFVWDEQIALLPSWAEENMRAITDKVNRRLKRVLPIYKEWKKDKDQISYEYEEQRMALRTKCKRAIDRVYNQNKEIMDQKYYNRSRRIHLVVEAMQDLNIQQEHKRRHALATRTIDKLREIPGYVE